MPEDMFSETINDIDWRQVMHYSKGGGGGEFLIEDRWVFSMVRTHIRAVSLFVFLKNLYKHKDKMQILHLKNYIHIGTGKICTYPNLTPTYIVSTKGLISNIYKYEEGYLL